jgi:transposase
MKQRCPLVPEARRFRMQAVEFDETTQYWTCHVTPNCQTAPCPRGSVRSKRVHRHSQRTLAALPWAEYTAPLHLQGRRFSCQQRRGSRHIFCARVPTVGSPHPLSCGRVDWPGALSPVGLPLRAFERNLGVWGVSAYDTARAPAAPWATLCAPTGHRRE